MIMGWEDNINGLDNSSSDFMRALSAYKPRESFLTPSDFLMNNQQMNLPAFASAPVGTLSESGGWWGKDGKMGDVNTALNVGKGLFGMWAGIKGMNMAKDQFNQQKMLSNENLRMNKLNYNMRLQSGQENKLAAMGQPAAASQGILSVAEQMKRYGA
jgi:hypothetical protein